MEQASTLAPDDKLYQDSLLLLKKWEKWQSGKVAEWQS